MRKPLCFQYFPKLLIKSRKKTRRKAMDYIVQSEVELIQITTFVVQILEEENKKNLPIAVLYRAGNEIKRRAWHSRL